MASNGSTNPFELLENSLKIREAARELLEEQINEVIKGQKGRPENEEEKLIRIMAKIPAERTAAEYLFLIGEVYKHAKDCLDFKCPWTTTCWRMKGLNYHVKLLKKVNKATPAALVQLWDRQVHFEMVIDDAHQYACPPDACTCRIIDNYRYFLMECVKRAKEEMNHLPEAGSEFASVSDKFRPVMDHFAGHMEFRYKVAGDRLYDILQNKKSSFALYHALYMKGVEDGARMLEESMQAREEEEKKKGDLSQETLTAAANYFKERIGDLTNAARMMEMAESLTDEQLSLLRSRVAAGAHPDPEADWEMQRAVRNGMMPKADKELNKNADCHHDSRACNCTIADVLVDLEIGLKKKIRLNEGFEKKPSTSVLKELRRRVTLLVFCRGPEQSRNFRPLVRVVTCMINGEPWKVVYNGDPHNFFTEVQFEMALTHYFFAGSYHYNAQIIMYNFLEQAYSEGKDRFEALLKDVGGKHAVLCNMAYSRPCEAKENAEKLKHGIRPILPKLISRGETVWFSGTSVKGVSGRIFHLWKNTLESDRKKFELITSHQGAKIPAPASYNHESPDPPPASSQNGPSTSQEQEELSDDEDLDQPCTSNTEWRDPRQNSEDEDDDDYNSISGEIMSMEMVHSCGHFTEHQRTVFRKYNQPIENWARRLIGRTNSNEAAKAFLLTKLKTERAKKCINEGTLPKDNKYKEETVPDEIIQLCYAEKRKRTPGTPLGELLFPTSREAYKKAFSENVSSSSSTVSSAPSQEPDPGPWPRVGEATKIKICSQKVPSLQPPRALAEKASEPEANEKSDSADSAKSQYAVWELEEVNPGKKKPTRRLVMTKLPPRTTEKPPRALAENASDPEADDKSDSSVTAVKNMAMSRHPRKKKPGMPFMMPPRRCVPLPPSSGSSTEESSESEDDDDDPDVLRPRRREFATPSKEFLEARRRSKERKRKAQKSKRKPGSTSK